MSACRFEDELIVVTPFSKNRFFQMSRTIFLVGDGALANKIGLALSNLQRNKHYTKTLEMLRETSPEKSSLIFGYNDHRDFFLIYYRKGEVVFDFIDVGAAVHENGDDFDDITTKEELMSSVDADDLEVFHLYKNEKYGTEIFREKLPYAYPLFCVTE